MLDARYLTDHSWSSGRVEFAFSNPQEVVHYTQFAIRV